ncbi:hypothetical protein N7447_007775 [Penicillium robsamsonii]|uniref:uncharacterized protein n=1 Tax=Penicillium robsamsonii TaxID=1792511 RepID=UPI0025477CC2|nr:uncharacterized protein N7447_007775 [Penicillium robsamsonii]KAJ5817767.1 hypothetical protein N7447_007775 [Penicillium robsamsonii]
MTIVHHDNMEPSSELIGFEGAPPIENPTMPVAVIPWSPPSIDPLPELGDTERAKLIDRLSKKAKESEADSTYWACLWLSDIECLREILRVAECSQSSASYLMTNKGAFTMIRAWKTRPSMIAGLPGTQGKRKLGEESPKRKFSAKTACLERHDFSCEITNFPQVDVAHIYPLSMRKGQSSGNNKKCTDTYDDFWKTLHMFWGKDQVDEWEARLTGPYDTELCENLLCLCPNAHRLWGSCYFALQPLHLRDDGKELITRFYWLPEVTRHKVQVQDKPSISLHPLAELLNLRVENTDGSAHKMNSGDLVIFQTKDPENLPLPSWDLLQMQWILHRIGALSGAVNVPMKPWYCDSEDEGSDMGFEDVFEPYQDEYFAEPHHAELSAGVESEDAVEPDEEDTQLPPILGRPSRFQSSFEINPNADFPRRRSPSSEKSL